MVVNACRCLRHAPADCGSNNISRRQIFLRVHALHDSFASGIEQYGALAAHCFADECLLLCRTNLLPQHRWVKLHKLQVAQRHSRAQSKCMTVTRNCSRVRRAGKHLPVATSGNHHRTCKHNPNAGNRSIFVQQRNSHAGNLAPCTGRHTEHQVERKRVIEHFDASVNCTFVQRALNLGAGLIAACMHNARARVPTFARESAQSVCARVECRTKFF